MEARLSIVSILLLVTLGCQGAVGDDSYFMKRSKMLESAPVKFYPKAEESKTDERHYENSEPIPHNYKLIINEADMCFEYQKVFLLVIIKAYYPNFRWREINREQLKHRSRLLDQRGLVVKFVFMFGAFSDPSVMKLIKQESNKYHDILQEDFQESYINASLKVSMGYKWTVTYCPNAEYVIVAEDELSFDINKIVSFLLKDHSKKPYDDHFAICYPVENDSPMHKTKPRFTGLDPRVLYKGNYYPPYCRGFGYGAHIKVINKLYRATLITPSFVPTEAWVGVMSEKLRLKTPNHKQLFIEENLEAYHADPKYPDLPGAIAVPNSRGYRGYEIEALKSIMKSMRGHWMKDPQDHSFPIKKDGKMDKNKDSRDKMGTGGNSKLKMSRWKGNGVEIGKENGKGPQMGKEKGNGAKIEKVKYRGVETLRVKDKAGMRPVKIDKQKHKDDKMDIRKDKRIRTNTPNDNRIKLNEEDKRFHVDKQIDKGVKIGKGGNWGSKFDKGKDKMGKPKVKGDKIGRGKYKIPKMNKKMNTKVKTAKHKFNWLKIDKWKGSQKKALYTRYVHDTRKQQSVFRKLYVYFFVALSFVVIILFRKPILNVLAKLYHSATCLKNK